MAENEFLAAFGITPEEEQAKYDRVASEILRRDGNAEWREWRAWWLAGGAILTTIICAVGMAWFAIRGQRVQVMVQVVQHDEQGRMIKIGIPMDLLAYQPQEGAVRDMLAEWITKRHWRGEGESAVARAHDDWRWLYLHTCGTGRKQLEEAEKVEKPLKPSTKRVQVDVESITKTMTPESYQVLWKATTTEKYNPRPDVVEWTSTLTVGRVSPKTLTDATLNNLGLCVTGVDDDKRH
jgi:type IV secretory pathway TrbF-like protein